MFGVSYWILPLASAVIWFATLLAMLITWLVQGRPVYPSMEANQTIAYISDLGAQGLKPLFIAGSTVSVVCFDLAFLSERWLRHKGRLAHNTSRNQKGLSIAACIASVVGAAGLILLTIFDTLRHPHLHDAFLVIFIGGYIISAIFICAEYGLLGTVFREHSILRYSFILKFFFIIVEIVLAIAFAVLGANSHRNTAAVLEWVISLLYILYVLSFVIDFLPALKSREHRFPTVAEMGQVNGPSNSGGPVYPEDGHNVPGDGRNSPASSAQPMVYPAGEHANHHYNAPRNF